MAVLFDTFGDRRTAYLFRTNALAIQQDGRIVDNGRTEDLRWDTSTSHFHIRYTEIDPGILDDFNAVGFLRDDDPRVRRT